ncbi:MAG: amidohydrolase family protein [Phycisphaerales bacterium]|nr:amidohydrolase family protein [Phycisphaerales bacterium]
MADKIVEQFSSLSEHHPVLCRDAEFFDRELRSFVPPGAFDAHAHLYTFPGTFPPSEYKVANAQDGIMSVQAYQQFTSAWMGDRYPRNGLFFGVPTPTTDRPNENKFVADQVRKLPGSRALMVVHPKDDPAQIERTVREEGFVGFKVYHCYADRPDSFNAATGEFLSEWMWELANKHGLGIMLHMVRPRALSDEDNQKYIQSHCRKYPNARLILAHAARGFCARHTVFGIESLRGLDNVFFDSSAICEPEAFQAIIQTMGTQRLMFAMDFPVCNMRGRCVSVGDSFFWMYQDNVDWKSERKGEVLPMLIGIESLLALQVACQQLRLSDPDIERLFGGNARQLLGLA